jgi:hypothetical protein
MPGRLRPPTKGPSDAKVQQAEDMFRKMMQGGKVTASNIKKVKERIAKKTGVYPIGDTN